MQLPKGRLGQVRQFVEAAKSDKPTETGDMPVESEEEIRFKIGWASLPPKLSEKAIKTTLLLFCKAHPNFPKQPKQYPIELYQTGNVVLAYIATKLPDIVEPFASKQLPYPRDEEEAKVRILKRADHIINSPSAQAQIEENRDIFNWLDDVIGLFQEDRSRIKNLLPGIL